MKKQLYPVQATHASVLLKAIERHDHALDASSTGCGKTLVSAEIATYLKRPTFVIGLKASIPMWEQELADRGVEPVAVLNFEKLRTGKTQWGSWARGKLWQWNLPKDALLIWDEVHNCQGFSSLNSKMLVGSKSWTNLMLSATSVEDPTDMRALGYILGLHNLRDFWAWCKRNGCVENGWGGLEFGKQLGVNYHEILAKLHYQIFPEHGSRLSVADLKDHFQETQIITTPVEFGSEIKKIYAEMEAELKNLREVMKSDSSDAQALVEQLRGRQNAELCKVPVMIQMTEDLMREGRSVVLFVNFRATIEALDARLVGAMTIQGGQPEENQIAMKAFQDNSCRLLICNSQAGGVSLNLHDLHGGHPRTSIISPSFNAKQILQVMGRVHRAGGKTPSQQHVLFAAGTIEEEVKDALHEKMDRIDIFNKGDEKSTAGLLAKQRNTVDVPPPITDTVIHMTETKPVPAAVPEEAHAEYNPSSLGMFEKCPGYRNREGTTDQADKGTRIHTALEKNTIGDLPEDERPLAKQCQDFIDGIIADRLPALPDFDYREIKLAMDLEGGISTFGTCDRLISYGSFAYMIDYKSGYRFITDASQNAQAFAYVIGAFQRFRHLEEIEFYFLIPNRDQISFHRFKRSDLPEMKLRLNTIIRRAMVADYVSGKNFNPQPELCEYCAMQAICPKIAEKSLLVAARLADGLELPVSNIVDKARPDDIPKLLRLAPLVEAWAAGVREAALKLNLEDGLEIPGFKRQERKIPRSLNSVWGAWKAIKDKTTISLEDFLSACSKVSIPKLETLAQDAVTSTKRGAKKEARMSLENTLRHAQLMNEGGVIYYLREDKK